MQFSWKRKKAPRRLLFIESECLVFIATKDAQECEQVSEDVINI